jgi:hypothetical protein
MNFRWTDSSMEFKFLASLTFKSELPLQAVGLEGELIVQASAELAVMIVLFCQFKLWI